MDHFELVSEYAPTGDQPEAIEGLVKGFQEGKKCQTLLGVTGSGKTFTMANVIAQLNKPTIIGLFLSKSLIVFAVAGVVLIACIVISKVPFRYMIKGLKPVWILLVFTDSFHTIETIDSNQNS